MPRAVRPQTNIDKLRKLISNLDGIEGALLRERIIKIMDITERDVKANPETYANPIVHPSAYLELADKVRQYIGFDKD